MRIRDSDLPSEEEWSKFFNPARTLELMGVGHMIKDIADFGCDMEHSLYLLLR